MNSLPIRSGPHRHPQRRRFGNLPKLAGVAAVAAFFFIAGRMSLPQSSPSPDTRAYNTPSSDLSLRKDLPVEIWAPGDLHPASAAVNATLDPKKRQELEQLCSRTLYHGLENIVVSHEMGHRTFFATG